MKPKSLRRRASGSTSSPSTCIVGEPRKRRAIASSVPRISTIRTLAATPSRATASCARSRAAPLLGQPSKKRISIFHVFSHHANLPRPSNHVRKVGCSARIGEDCIAHLGCRHPKLHRHCEQIHQFFGPRAEDRSAENVVAAVLDEDLKSQTSRRRHVAMSTTASYRRA